MKKWFFILPLLGIFFIGCTLDDNADNSINKPNTENNQGEGSEENDDNGSDGDNEDNDGTEDDGNTNGDNANDDTTNEDTGDYVPNDSGLPEPTLKEIYCRATSNLDFTDWVLTDLSTKEWWARLDGDPDMYQGNVWVIRFKNVLFSDYPGQTYSKYFNFAETTVIESMRLPEGIHIIPSSFVAQCYNLTSFTIPQSVEAIWPSAFYECKRLHRITIPKGVKYIGKSAFSSCTNLTNVVLPDSLTTLEEYAFYGCKGFTDITIPDGVTEIGDKTFAGCENLTAIYSKSLTPPTLGESAFNGTPSNMCIYVPNASVEKYKTAEGWSQYADFIEGYNF